MLFYWEDFCLVMTRQKKKDDLINNDCVNYNGVHKELHRHIAKRIEMAMDTTLV